MLWICIFLTTIINTSKSRRKTNIIFDSSIAAQFLELDNELGSKYEKLIVNY